MLDVHPRRAGEINDELEVANPKGLVPVRFPFTRATRPVLLSAWSCPVFAQSCVRALGERLQRPSDRYNDLPEESTAHHAGMYAATHHLPIVAIPDIPPVDQCSPLRER